tara:strand:- start:50589 stop:52160 length:1572 start_codon:yes stop_codon:yes gene_type:complete
MSKLDMQDNAVEQEVIDIMAAYSAGELELALQKTEALLEIHPRVSMLHNLMGVFLAQSSRPNDARASYQKALKINPDFFEAHNNLGNLYQSLAMMARASKHFKRAIRSNPDIAQTHNSLGQCLQTLGKSDQAQACYEKTIALDPEYAPAYNNLANVFTEVGEFDNAVEYYDKAIELTPGFVIAYKNLSVIKKYQKGDEQIEAMEKLLAVANAEEGYKKWLYFALAKAYEDTENFDKSFSCLENGNRIRKKELAYDISIDTKLFENIRARFSQRSAPVEKLAVTDLQPIFVIGMPRSGTSLIEQILASHSTVFGAGELGILNRLARPIVNKIPAANAKSNIRERAKDIRELRKSYFDAVRNLGFDKRVFVDKMPLNFRWLGLMMLAFPEAKFIHTVRDPIATCWSCYKHYFYKGNGFSYDMKDLLEYHKNYQDLMEFWKELYPGRIFDLNYEQLTSNQEVETRNLLEYCDLEWETNCLEFHKTKRSVQTASAVQVREAMYAGSSEAWKKFESHLGILTEGLQTN